MKSKYTALLLHRISAAQRSGTPLKDLAKAYGLSYYELSKQLSAYRKERATAI